MWVIIVNVLAAVLSVINFFLGSGGDIHWVWLITALCFGFTALREYRKLKAKE